MLNKKNVTIFNFLLVLVISLIFCSGLVSGMSPVINYQGYITNDNGTPLTEKVNMTFNLYREATDGSAIWTETHNDVSVVQGIFNEVLGDISKFDLSMLDADIYIGLKVADQEIFPRRKLTGAIFSFRSEYAENANTTNTADMTNMANTANTAYTTNTANTVNTADTTNTENTTNTANTADTTSTENTSKQLEPCDGSALKSVDSSNTTVSIATTIITTVQSSTTTILQSFTNSIGMQFVYIPAGTFTMGSPTSEGKGSDETQHQVTLTNGYYMQTTEVTQGQWKAVMETNPSYFSSCGDNCPVEKVSWDSVQIFIGKLNQKESKTYRLPTEAEWEYAARAGSTTAFYNGGISVTDYNCNPDSNLDKIGWYCANSSNKTHPVAQKQINAWGLYDMSGNVWEWCHDWYGDYSVAATTGSFRVFRGGSWLSLARDCRSANRGRDDSGRTVADAGFRLVVTQDSDKNKP